MWTDEYTTRNANGRGPRARSGVPRWLKYLLALIPLSAAGAAVARTINGVETKAHAESTYVTHAEYALQHQRDSSSTASTLHDMSAVLFGLDSSDHCRRGYRAYCR